MRRRLLWRELSAFWDKVDGAWCVGGDFNAILFENERRSSRRDHSMVDKDFFNWYSDSGLSHLHTVGSFYTWSREGCESKLDRVLVNDVFMDRFPEAKITVLYSFKSNHKALWLSTVIFQRRPRFEHLLDLLLLGYCMEIFLNL